MIKVSLITIAIIFSAFAISQPLQADNNCFFGTADGSGNVNLKIESEFVIAENKDNQGHYQVAASCKSRCESRLRSCVDNSPEYLWDDCKNSYFSCLQSC